MDFMAELSRLIDLPADTILQYRYTVFGGRAVYVAGHKGIRSFGSDVMELKIGKQSLVITGQNLSIKHLSNDDMIIIGDINSVAINK